MGSIRENIFSQIDSKEKAYWLGFLYADGNVAKSGNRIGFHLAIKDVILLERFCDFVGGDRDRIVSYNDNNTVYFYIYSKTMKDDLAKYHIVPRKTYKEEFPIFDDIEIFLAFFMGAYDGDGTVGYSTISSANHLFLEYCCTKFNINVEKIQPKNNKYGSCYSLNIGCSNYINVLLNYENSLARKRRTQSKSFNGEVIGLSICSKCGTVISKKSSKCKKCSAIENNITNVKFEVTNEELAVLVREKPMTEIGKMFGVSDNAIRKRCKKLGIELKPMRGHWRKIETGKI